MNIVAREVPDAAAVVAYFRRLQDDICRRLAELDPTAKFVEERWKYAAEKKSAGGGGHTRALIGGEVFEKGGVNFSNIHSPALPASASLRRAEVSGKPMSAAGVSVVLHPLNPYVPCCHMNARFFLAAARGETPIWWFGGGYDLTPCYPYPQDCIAWHRAAKRACDPFGAGQYARFKKWCDEYFYLPHRGETRGVGGLFFDDYCAGGFAQAFAFTRAIADSFIAAYRPIVERRRHTPYTAREKKFQEYRRGRYVEFNLAYDRGTRFGLESGGRAESILMSLPPTARWRYAARGDCDADAQKLAPYLQPRDWLNE